MSDTILVVMVVLLGGAHLYAQAEIARRLDRVIDLLHDADGVEFEPEGDDKNVALSS